MTTSGPDGSRAEKSVGRPGPRWEAGDAIVPASEAGAPEVIEARTLPPPSGGPQDAQIWRRSTAWLVDELARTFFYPLLLIVLVMLGGEMPDPVSPTEVTLTAILPQIVLRIGLSWIFWSQGTSPGAMVMGLRIVDAQGNPPGPVRGGIRALVEIVSISMLLVGFAWALFTRRRQTWHDLAAGTYIVDAPRAREA